MRLKRRHNRNSYATSNLICFKCNQQKRVYLSWNDYLIYSSLFFFFIHSVKVTIYNSDVYFYLWEGCISINNNYWQPCFRSVSGVCSPCSKNTPTFLELCFKIFKSRLRASYYTVHYQDSGYTKLIATTSEFLSSVKKDTRR